MLTLDESLLQVFNDNQSGSVAVLQQLTRSILSFLVSEQDNQKCREVLTNRLPVIQKSLGHFAVVNHFLKYLEEKIYTFGDLEKDMETLFDSVKNYDDFWKDANRKVAEVAFENLDCEGKTILLHSNSSVVTSFFRKLAEKGVNVRVIQTESRPVNEGRYQAQILAGLGFSVDFIVDAAMGFMIPEVDLAITGADQIHKNYLVNKIGTHALGLLCREAKVPLYVLADSRKIASKPGNPETLRRIFRPSADVWNVMNERIHPVNYYFEPADSSLFTSIITEKSVITPDEL
jgi:translation initiation factor 2B subunit (eIF-2B alpha/beta/delta family)